MKIAVPVEGENLLVVKRTGQTPYFAIFQDNVLETIVQASTEKHSHEHSHKHGNDNHHEDDEAHIAGHGKSLNNLHQCDVMLVRMIGEHMREAVERAGITIKKIREKDGEKADEVVKSFLDKQKS